MQYWLMKSEPGDYSIDDLERDGTAPWDGIRTYQARNLMRDNMEVGDRILFYHSNTKPPGVVGVAGIAGRPYPDHMQFDPDAKYYDPPRTGTIPAGSWSTWDSLRSCQEWCRSLNCGHTGNWPTWCSSAVHAFRSSR